MIKPEKNLVSISSLGGKKQVNEKKSRSSRPEVFCKKGFLKISQNSQENTCTGVSFYESHRFQVSSCAFCEIFKSTYFVKPKWTAAFENHVYLNSIEQFPEFQSDDVIVFTHRIGNAYTAKIPRFIRSSRPEIFRPATLWKKRPWHSCFLGNWAKFLRALFLTGHLPWLLVFYGDWVFCFPGGGFPVFWISWKRGQTWEREL